MFPTRRRFQFAAARSSGVPAWLSPLVRALALIGLFLLPVQLRAGTANPHPHALFQLLLDSRDGGIDHHARSDEDARAHDHRDTVAASGVHRPDLPAFGDVIQASGGLTLLATTLFALLLPPAGSARVWPPPHYWQDRIPSLEPPPPRFARS